MQDLTPRAKDSLVSFGERLSTRIFAAFLNRQGVPAQQMDAYEIGVVTNDNFLNAGQWAALGRGGLGCGTAGPGIGRLVGRSEGGRREQGREGEACTVIDHPPPPFCRGELRAVAAGTARVSDVQARPQAARAGGDWVPGQGAADGGHHHPGPRRLRPHLHPAGRRARPARGPGAHGARAGDWTGQGRAGLARQE